MNLIRNRAKEHFPSVLLTLLSIVQALALELLWEHVQESSYLMQWSWQSFINWLQIATTLFGIILIWVAYASNALRFRWVPSTLDSVYPFIIGLLEFTQIAALGPGMVGQWTVLMAAMYGLMVLVSHFTMRRARHSGDNGTFFEESQPAVLRDFYPNIAIVIALTLSGSYVWASGHDGVFSTILILAGLCLLVSQYYLSAMFWNSSIAEDE
ncbi:MAG: hypothetical protein AAF431_03585 [Pseudomonadota bacterium]